MPNPIGSATMTKTYQDVAVACKIDPSNNDINADLDIVNEQLRPNPIRRESFVGEVSWSDHIKLNEPSIMTPSRGAGIFVESPSLENFTKASSQTKTFVVDEVPDNINPPTSPASYNLSLEVINLNSSYKVQSLSAPVVANSSFSNLHTGRPVSISLLNAGAGYTGKDSDVNGSVLSKSIYQETFTVTSVNILDDNTSNLGYKPQDHFYIYGISSTLDNIGNINYAYYQFKAKAVVGSRGNIENIDIIDGGVGFDDLLDPNDLVLAEVTHAFNPLPRANQNTVAKAISNSVISLLMSQI